MKQQKKEEGYNRYRKYFGSYGDKFEGFYNSGGLAKIQDFLKRERETKTLLPSGNLIFRAFTETPLDSLKVVFLGLSPYFTIGCPDGLAFSCGLTKKEQPSLKVLLDACEQNLGYKDDRNPDLKRWAEQGVLLLNSSLTTLPGDARCHLGIWQPFIQYFFENVINDKELIIVFFGKDSQYFQQFTNPKLHYSIATNHPSYFARNNAPMNTSLFSDTNRILKERGKSEIKWQEYGALPFRELEEKGYKQFI